MNSKRVLHTSPGVIVLASLFVVIIIGTMLLSLAAAQTKPISLIDTFFTATSALCVTGLFTIPLDSFTFFGHCVIMALMQIGGLGLITMTLIFLSLFVNFGLSTQLMVGHILDLESWKNIKNILLFIALITFASELMGTLLIMLVLTKHEPIGSALFHALFHSIASFCNAGIELPHIHTALYRSNYAILCTTMALSLIGGLGFITWHEIVSWVKARWQNKRFRFSLHSKIIFYGSSTLLLVSACIIWLLEHAHAYRQMDITHSIVYALFQAITSKSTGFSFIPLGEFQLATVFIMMIIAFIGSSPASTGSGIKITTFTILLATVKTALSGRTIVSLKGRRIAPDQVFKSVAICFLGISSIALVTFLLLISERGWSFFDIFFEALSALTNLGTSLSITPTLSTFGKLLIMTSMMIGRVGSFALILGLKMIRGKETNEFIYPEERVML